MYTDPMFSDSELSKMAALLSSLRLEYVVLPDQIVGLCENGSVRGFAFLEDLVRHLEFLALDPVT